jgi:hypothetical protein
VGTNSSNTHGDDRPVFFGLDSPGFAAIKQAMCNVMTMTQLAFWTMVSYTKVRVPRVPFNNDDSSDGSAEDSDIESGSSCDTKDEDGE